MTKKRNNLLALDVGEKRIGVAVADGAVRIAVPFDTIEVDGNEVATIIELILNEEVGTLVVGYPRNQSGESTAQTEYAEAFARHFSDVDVEIAFQDESLTSVHAEAQLKSHGRPYSKGDIDKQAAALILQDYLEAYER